MAKSDLSEWGDDELTQPWMKFMARSIGVNR